MSELGGRGTDWTLNLSSEQASDFLRSLVEDDAFRREVENAPGKALAGKGIAVPPEAIEGPVTLPSKADLIRTFGAAFPDLQPRRTPFSRFIQIFRPWPTPVPFGGVCHGWAIAYGAARRIAKKPQP